MLTKKQLLTVSAITTLSGIISAYSILFFANSEIRTSIVVLLSIFTLLFLTAYAISVYEKFSLKKYRHATPAGNDYLNHLKSKVENQNVTK